MCVWITGMTILVKVSGTYEVPSCRHSLRWKGCHSVLYWGSHQKKRDHLGKVFLLLCL